jgi:hypothetical protein
MYRLKHISILCLKCATTKALHLVTLFLSTLPHTEYNIPLPRWQTNHFNYVHTSQPCFVTAHNSPTLRQYTELFQSSEQSNTLYTAVFKSDTKTDQFNPNQTPTLSFITGRSLCKSFRFNVT